METFLLFLEPYIHPKLFFFFLGVLAGSSATLTLCIKFMHPPKIEHFNKVCCLADGTEIPIAIVLKNAKLKRIECPFTNKGKCSLRDNKKCIMFKYSL